MIDPAVAVMCLIDHQSGLVQLVRDIDQPVLRRHATCLARVSYLAKIPTFTTASVPDGPNGPLIPEIDETNPDAIYIPRTGQINTRHNPAWVESSDGVVPYSSSHLDNARSELIVPTGHGAMNHPASVAEILRILNRR